MIADLDCLNRSTEQDFLGIGEKLAGFMGTAKMISSELTALMELISGEQGTHAAEALTAALDASTQMKGLAEEGCRVLRGMSLEARRLKQTLSAFQGTVSTFHTLEVLTRVETARLGVTGADFGNLADEVKVLTGNIQARVESALAAAARLIPPIEGAMRSVSALAEGQVKELPAIIADVLTSLSSFREMQETAHAASLRLRERYDGILAAFTNLIVSIQFHDITRQQVEHVIEALRRLRSESGPDDGAASRDPRTFAAVALQSSQLADAGTKFDSSVTAVAHSLDEIAEKVLEMAGECGTLTGFSEDEHNSFFLRMEQGCAAILASLGVCAEAEAATRSTIGGLTETISRLRECVDEVQAIEIQIQRMALNGGIRAAHVGAKGEALSVLAGSMQSLADDSRQRSDSLLEALGRMSEAAGGLSAQRGSTPDAMDDGRDSFVQGMRTTVTELHTSSERSFARIAQITARGARLREDLSAARQSFAVGAVFAESVERAREMLAAIGGDRQAAGLREGAADLERELDNFAKHYTMQSEREVHRAASAAPEEAEHRAAWTEPVEFLTGEAGEPVGDVEFF